MKTLIILAFFVCKFSNINAQHSIIGKVIIENSDTLEANVQLYTKNNTSVFTLQTQKGIFSFSNLMKNKTYYVVASHIGYATDTIKIDRITKDTNIGTMYLKRNHVKLNEITVVGSCISFQNGSKRIFPNEFQKNSPDAMVMLDKMNLSRINVNPLTKSITLNGGGSIKVLLNGREVSMVEIAALSPDIIQRIEYHDTPEARYGNTDVVLDFITKTDNVGARVYLSLWQGMLTHFGEDYVSMKLNRGNAQFSLDYNLAYRNWKHLSREYKETFNLQDVFFSRTELGNPGRFEYINHNIRLNCNYQKNKKIINFSFGTAIQNTPYKEWKSYLHYQKSVLNLYDNAKSSATNPYSQLYIQLPIGDRQLYAMNLSGHYNKGKYNRMYQETDSESKTDQFISNARETQKGYALSQLYENRQNWGTLTIGANFSQQFSQSSYDYVKNDIERKHHTNIHLSNLYSYAQWGKGWNKLYSRAGIGMNQRWMYVGEQKQNIFTVRPTIFIRYIVTPKIELRYQGSVSNIMPSQSALSDYSQEIDLIQTQKGNPNLKPQIDFYNALVFNYNFSKTALVLYLNQTYSKSPIMESTYCEDKKVIRTQENHKKFQNYNVEIEYGGMPFGNMLSFKAFAGMKFYKSNGNQYTHHKTIHYYGGQISAYYKQFTMRWQFRKNVQDKFWGETLYRYEDGHMLSFGYQTNKINLSADVLNLFSLKHISAQENYSSVAPYKRYEYLNETRNLIRLNLTLNLSYGKNHKEFSKRINDNTNSESSIIKGEK